jgi:hypothetical protein
VGLQILFGPVVHFCGLQMLFGVYTSFYGSADTFLRPANATCGLRVLFRACGSIKGSADPDFIPLLQLTLRRIYFVEEDEYEDDGEDVNGEEDEAAPADSRLPLGAGLAQLLAVGGAPHVHLLHA